MERITDEDAEYERQLNREEVENMENLRTLTKEELVRLCSGFARENMKLIHWLHRHHRDILRDYESKHLDGNHIDFA
jgi:hypothetical protein